MGAVSSVTMYMLFDMEGVDEADGALWEGGVANHSQLAVGPECEVKRGQG